MTAKHTNSRFCWWCGIVLKRHPATGREISEEVIDPIGNKHQVHRTCKKDVRFGDPMQIDTHPLKPHHQ